MIRAVLDANTIVSGMARFHTGTSPPVLILRDWMNAQFMLLISDYLLNEVTRTLAKPYFRSHVAADVYALTIQALAAATVPVPVTHMVINLATHPEDDFVLATAVSAQADYLVTGDKQLQRLENVEGVSIVSPRDFLNALQEDT